MSDLDSPVSSDYAVVRPAYRWAALWRKYPIELAKPEGDQQSLQKCLHVWDLIAYGIGSTVGAGIFVVTGGVARDTAGPAIVISFLLAAFASLMSAFCYAEFAARIPVSGSAYTFAYVSVGEFIGWIIGWNLTLEYAISASAVARSWSGYVVSFFKIVEVSVPDWLAGYSLPWLFDLSILSVIIVAIMTLLMLFGVKKNATVNLVITVLNLITILFVIVVGSIYVETSNWDDFFPYGVKGAISGAGTVFFSFIGFDAVTTLAGEVKNPSRDLPAGVVGTLGIATVLYVAVSLVITGVVNYSALDENAPLSQAFLDKGLRWAAAIVGIGSITTLTSTTWASLMGQPRIFYQMAVDGLLPGIFKRLNSHQIPVWGSIITGICAATIAFLFDLGSLTDMISIGTLMAFTIVCASVLVLRYQTRAQPYKIPAILIIFVLGCFFTAFLYKYDFPYWSLAVSAVPLLFCFLYILTQKTISVPETFRCPFVPLLPCVGIFVNIYLIVSLTVEAFYRIIIWTAIGIAIYLVYGIRNSTLRLKGLEKDDDNYSPVATHINT